MDREQNPFRTIRRAAGLSQIEQAAQLGLSPKTLALVEAGAVANPQALLDAFARRGHDAQQLLARYRAWREQRQVVGA